MVVFVPTCVVLCTPILVRFLYEGRAVDLQGDSYCLHLLSFLNLKECYNEQ